MTTPTELRGLTDQLAAADAELFRYVMTIETGRLFAWPDHGAGFITRQAVNRVTSVGFRTHCEHLTAPGIAIASLWTVGWWLCPSCYSAEILEHRGRPSDCDGCHEELDGPAMASDLTTVLLRATVNLDAHWLPPRLIQLRLCDLCQSLDDDDEDRL